MTDPKEVVEIPKDNAIFGASFATFEKFGYSPAETAKESAGGGVCRPLLELTGSCW